MILQWVFKASLTFNITFEIIYDKYSVVYFGGALALSAPIALLADLYLGRYKVMILLWVAVIASNTIIALQYYSVYRM